MALWGNQKYFSGHLNSRILKDEVAELSPVLLLHLTVFLRVI
jgi:hypothetical protein